VANFLTAIGIRSTGGYTQTVIDSNNIFHSRAGIIVLASRGDAAVTNNSMRVNGVGVSVVGAIGPVVNLNGISAYGAGVMVAFAPGSTVSGNGLTMHGLGGGIAVGASPESAVLGNNIISPTIGVLITHTLGISVSDNTISDPATTGIILSQDTAGRVDANEIDNSVLGIHYQVGKDAVISNNIVNSLGGGTGIRLGTGAAGCPVAVDNILVQDNDLNGGAIGVEVLCDVGTHTLIGN
jgi:nitrous oxidase accessory protein NosD